MMLTSVAAILRRIGTLSAGNSPGTQISPSPKSNFVFVIDGCSPQHDAGVAARKQWDVNPRQDVEQAAVGHRRAFLEHDEMVAQATDFLDVVADVDHRHRQFVVQAIEVRQQFVLAPPVERGERLVHENEIGRAHERRRDGDTLRFAARQRLDPTIEQRTEFEHVDDVRALDPARAGSPGTVVEVAAHVEVRKQRRLLEHVPYVTSVHGRAVPAFETGNAAQQRGLARARLAKHPGDAGVRYLRVDVEHEVALVHLVAQADHRRLQRWLSANIANRTANANTSKTSDRRCAAA
ncbi:MAG: hypothetical protein P8X94_00660 [Woeseiaceae bacterium]